MAKSLIDYIGKKYRDRVESVERLPDYWDEEEKRFRHRYKITCKDDWGFDTGGGFNKEGYPETVSQLNAWFKEYSVKER